MTLGKIYDTQHTEESSSLQFSSVQEQRADEVADIYEEEVLKTKATAEDIVSLSDSYQQGEDYLGGQFMMHSGPLPTAKELAQYEEISAGMGEKLMALYAQSLSRADDRADRITKAKEWRHLVTLMAAFILAIIAGCGGIDALQQGDTTTGLTLSGGSLSAVILAFLKATNSSE